MIRKVAAFCAVFACVCFAAGCGGTSTPTPTHVVAIWVDAFNHADLRAACSVVAPSTYKHWASEGQSPLVACQTNFLMNLAQGVSFGGVLGGYAVVPHSYKGWREGRVEVASVKVKYLPTAQLLTARLVKTAHGWKIASLK